MQNELTNIDDKAVEQVVKVLKRQPGLGKLNRLIAAAQMKLKGMGHNMKRFDRDYTTGTATSTCKHCGATVTVNINGKTLDEKMQGEALTVTCSHVNS